MECGSIRRKPFCMISMDARGYFRSVAAIHANTIRDSELCDESGMVPRSIRSELLIKTAIFQGYGFREFGSKEVAGRTTRYKHLTWQACTVISLRVHRAGSASARYVDLRFCGAAFFATVLPSSGNHVSLHTDGWPERLRPWPIAPSRGRESRNPPVRPGCADSC